MSKTYTTEHHQLIVDHPVFGDVEVSAVSRHGGFTWSFSDIEVEIAIDRDEDAYCECMEYIESQVKAQIAEIRSEADMSAELDTQADKIISSAVDLPWDV